MHKANLFYCIDFVGIILTDFYMWNSFSVEIVKTTFLI